MKKTKVNKEDGNQTISLYKNQLPALSVNRISWSPNGKLLACPSDRDKIIIWDWKSGKVQRTLTRKSIL